LWLSSLLTSVNTSSLSMLSRCNEPAHKLDGAPMPASLTRTVLLPGYAKAMITARTAVIARGLYAATRCAAMI
jgi:hypothetical protein